MHSSCSCCSVHYVKRPGAVLEAGAIVARLELDDPTRVKMVSRAAAFNPFVVHSKLTLDFTTVDDQFAVHLWKSTGCERLCFGNKAASPAAFWVTSSSVNVLCCAGGVVHGVAAGAELSEPVRRQDAPAVPALPRRARAHPGRLLHPGAVLLAQAAGDGRVADARPAPARPAAP